MTNMKSRVIYRMNKQEKAQLRELQRVIAMNQGAARQLILSIVEREAMPPNTMLDNKDLVFREATVVAAGAVPPPSRVVA